MYDFAQQRFPQIMLNQFGPKAPDGSGIRHIAAQLKVAEFTEQKITE